MPPPSDSAVRLPPVAGRLAPLRAATARRADARVPFFIDGVEVGSVARTHLPLLAQCSDAPHVADDRVVWRDGTGGRDARLARLNHELRSLGLIRAWRDEAFAIVDPASLRVLARIERAAARFWGTLTFGAHANGYIRDAGQPGGPPTHLWIAQRSPTKATDPGCHDNLVGGGVPHGQAPAETLVREGWEEAGLTPAQMAGHVPGSVLRLQRDIPEGLQHEWLYSFDLELPAGWVPRNQDGEVSAFTLMPVDEALALACGGGTGPAMTVDAALVTLDFGVRHRLLADPDLARALEALRIVRLP